MNSSTATHLSSALPEDMNLLAKRGALTPAQRHMYQSEKLVNFRFISKLVASPSPITLKASDLASAEIEKQLSEIGQFAEVAYNFLDTERLYRHLPALSQVNYPLEGYDAFTASELVSAFRGEIADLPVFVSFRPGPKQLVVAISGTSSPKQVYYDMQLVRLKHPVGHGCEVHMGFWKLYQGLKARLLKAIVKGVEEHDVEELAITGHSMGGSISYLLALDVLEAKILERPIPIKLAIFGAPRCANVELSLYWRKKAKAYRDRNGESYLQEWSVRGYNDGVPAVPLLSFGFRHFSERPLYLFGGRLYHVPPSEAEYTLFTVEGEKDEERVNDYPRGGHNYYNGRDMEKLVRRMRWIEENMNDDDDDWQERYLKWTSKKFL